MTGIQIILMYWVSSKHIDLVQFQIHPLLEASIIFVWIDGCVRLIEEVSSSVVMASTKFSEELKVLFLGTSFH